MNSHILKENEKVIKVGKVSKKPFNGVDNGAEDFGVIHVDRGLINRVEEFELAIPEETMKALIDLIDSRIDECLKESET